MPLGTCDSATRGEAHNQIAMEVPLTDSHGIPIGGSVLVDGVWDWDGVSVRPDCEGPILSLHTRNTGNVPCWALLPAKKKAPPWVLIPPGTDVTITAKGQLNNLGISNYTDVIGVGFSMTDPALG